MSALNSGPVSITAFKNVLKRPYFLGRQPCTEHRSEAIALAVRPGIALPTSGSHLRGVFPFELWTHSALARSEASMTATVLLDFDSRTLQSNSGRTIPRSR